MENSEPSFTAQKMKNSLKSNFIFCAVFVFHYNQLTFTSPKSAIETLEKDMKYIQS